MPKNCNSIILLDNSKEFCKENCKWGLYKRSGRKTIEKTDTKVGNRGKKVRKTKKGTVAICLTLDIPQYDYLKKQSVRLSVEKGYLINACDMIREAIATLYPLNTKYDTIESQNKN